MQVVAAIVEKRVVAFFGLCSGEKMCVGIDKIL